MLEPDYIIEKNAAVIKIKGRGRPFGSGSNLRTLSRMEEGDSLWDVPKNKMDSFRTSAHRHGIKLKIRRIALADGTLTNNYAIWRIS